MNKEVEKIVFDALHKGRIMRSIQKEYFVKRSQALLTESKKAEIDFDIALDEAAYAVKYGSAKPKQGTLF